MSRFTPTHVRTHAPTHDTLLAHNDREFAHIREQVKFLVRTSHDLMELFQKMSPSLEKSTAPNG